MGQEDLERRRFTTALVTERPRPDLQVWGPVDGGELHREWRHVVAEKPRVWMATIGAGENDLGNPTWDLAPDGKRVVVAALAGSADAPKQEHEVVFLQNFVDELSRRVPLGK